MEERASAATIGPGTVLNNTYRIERRLGEGGMGVVWEASHLRVPKRVAIKVLLVADADQLARFRQEAEVASRLGHPNIVDVLDFDTALGTPYMVMELLQGESLATRLERGPLDAERTITIVRQIASALQAAHDAGVIHRDLKPANVFLVPRELDGEPTDEVKVLDFGISKVQGSQMVRTNEGAVIGTPQYMAPEQAAARHDELDARTDQFALGAITYEMLAGRPAFEGETATQVMFKIVYESPPALDTVVAGLPSMIVRAVTRALSTRPGERFPDLAQFVAELSGRPLEAPVLARMNQNTLPASPRRVADAATAETRSESATAAERPRGRDDREATPEPVKPGARTRGASFALAGALVVGAAITVYVVTRPPSAATPDAGVASGSNVTDAAIVATDHGRTDGQLGGLPDAGSDRRAPVDAGVPGVRDAGVTIKREVIPADIALAYDAAEKEIAAGNLDAAESRVRRTTQTHEYPQADVLLATVGCARHDVAQAHTWMRRAGEGNWAAIRMRCTKLGFAITDP